MTLFMKRTAGTLYQTSVLQSSFIASGLTFLHLLSITVLHCLYLEADLFVSCVPKVEEGQVVKLQFI